MDGGCEVAEVGRGEAECFTYCLEVSSGDVADRVVEEILLLLRCVGKFFEVGRADPGVGHTGGPSMIRCFYGIVWIVGFRIQLMFAS